MVADERPTIRVGVVGACAAGKSTLVNALRQAGYEARHVAQEHSYVPSMWQQISRPDVLIYLDVNYESIRLRRPRIDLQQEDVAEQLRRLAHARENCDLYLDTNKLTTIEVREETLAYLRRLSLEV